MYIRTPPCPLLRPSDPSPRSLAPSLLAPGCLRLRLAASGSGSASHELVHESSRACMVLLDRVQDQARRLVVVPRDARAYESGVEWDET